MNFIDKNYLLLQFKDKIHSKNSNEFQEFFESIASKAFDDFVVVKPYGKQGDGGNDGYRRGTGIYYQVYSPLNTRDKDRDATKKFTHDFKKLKEKWEEIESIKEYNFVYNNKYHGTSIELERVRAELSGNNPGIKFNLFFANDLERLFISLSADDISLLGFDIDSRNTIQAVKAYLEKLEVELDRNNSVFVFKTLENIKTIIDNQNDEMLLLEYGILEARCLTRLERVIEARNRYEGLALRYPKDPRPFLYLAEISLNHEDFKQNEHYIQKAEIIDSTHWLLPLQKLIRELRLGTEFNASTIDESTFPDVLKKRSDYYRLYSLFFEKSGDTLGADSFIQRAIYLNPDKFYNYEVRLSHLEHRFLQEKVDFETKTIKATNFLKEVDDVENKLIEWGGLDSRSEALLNVKRLHTYIALENYQEIEKSAAKIFELIFNCYFDQAVDGFIWNAIQVCPLSSPNLSRLIEYLKNTQKPISDHIAEQLFLQFLRNKTLYTHGKGFFETIQKLSIVDLILALERRDYDVAMKLVSSNIQFCRVLAVAEEIPTEFRKLIISSIPEDQSFKKEKLRFLDFYFERDYKSAFRILQTLEVASLSYTECIPMLETAARMKAWDIVILIVPKLMNREREQRSILKLELDLFTANLNLERFPEVIRIGEAILSDSLKLKMLDESHQELLLVQTTYAWVKRGKYKEARELLDKYPLLIKKYETKISLQAQVYVRNNDPEAALTAVIEAVKIKRRLSPEDYGSLFFIFSGIGNLMDYTLISENEVAAKSFVKIKNRKEWLFVGDDDELDALKIPKAKHGLYLGKKVGERILLENPYSSEKNQQEIESIFDIGKYIFWQSMHYAQELSKDGMWDAMKVIEMPTASDGSIDPKFLIALLEDENGRGQKLFETYCKQNIPFALLALSEGGVPQAIGKIQNEQRGFIRFTDGSQQEFTNQKKVAESIIAGQQFYIDGTSALILSETGLLAKFRNFLPGIRSPQSVISLLLDLTEKFSRLPGQAGRLFYSKGKIGYSDIDENRQLKIRQNFFDAIEILEVNQENVDVISSANKSEKFSEKRVPACLSDATILAQREDVPILTEDYLYLYWNALETSKPRPQYCSAFSIVCILYEQGKISLAEYLNFFEYLSSYRFWFLPITISDIEKSIFGDGLITMVDIQGLRKLNIGLTFSEEYGVPLKVSHSLVTRFIIKMLVNDSVTASTLDSIFKEIVDTFPTDKDRQQLGYSLIIASVQLINKEISMIIGSQVQEKVDVLTRTVQMYNASSKILKL